MKIQFKTVEDIYKELDKKEVSIHDKYSYSALKTNNKTINMSLGRIWINLIFPENFELIDEPLNKKTLNKYIAKVFIKEKYPQKIIDFVTFLNKEAYKLTLYNPVSFDIHSFILSKTVENEKNSQLVKPFKGSEDNKPVEFLNALLDVAKIKMREDEKLNRGLADIINSGTKGDEALLSTLIIARGNLTDLEGNTSKPILSSLNEGFKVDEYYTGAAEARSLLFTKSKSAAEPGYLSRRTVFSLADIELDKVDCKTKKYLKLKVIKSLASKINGRYYLNEKTNQLELIEDGNKILDMTILMRSPIFCKSEIGICSTCFGELSKTLDTKYIGVSTGAMLFDIGITIAMKSRHNAVQFKTIKTNFVKEILI